MLALLFIGSAAAQITLAPQIKNIAQFAAVGTDGADACNSVVSKVNLCAISFSNADGIVTASPDEVVECACCADGEVFADPYSICSEAITEILPSFTTEASIYGDLYSACSATATCSGFASATGAPSSTTSDEPTSTSTSSAEATSAAETSEDSFTDATGTETDIAAITSAAALPSACSSMVDMFNSCVMETPGFSDMGFKSQAPCYCCGNSGNVWTDELDGYASECAADVKSGEDYNIASRFASFCNHFSDACDAATTTADEEATSTTAEETTTSTDSSAPEETTDDATEDDNADSNNSDDPSLAANLQLRSVVGFVAVVFGGFAMVVL